MPTSPPPVPENLREMLKDFPEHIAQLQGALAAAAEEPGHPMHRFEYATWAIEACLDSSGAEARAEVRAAKDVGDPTLIAGAESKEALMTAAAWKHVWLGDEALREYFGARMGNEDE